MTWIKNFQGRFRGWAGRAGQIIQAGQTEPTVVGQIEIATFFNEAGLEAIGDNLMLETAASGPRHPGRPGRARLKGGGCND